MLNIPSWVFSAAFSILCLSIFAVLLYVTALPEYIPKTNKTDVIQLLVLFFGLGAVTGLVFAKLIFVILKPGGPRRLPRFASERSSANVEASPAAAKASAQTRKNKSMILQSMEKKILGTDRLECLEKLLPSVNFITKEEADEIVAMFAGEAHAIQAYDILEAKILSPAQAKAMEKKGTLADCRANSKLLVTRLRSEMSLSPMSP